MTPRFDHEKLRVYQQSLLFCGWVGRVVEELPAKAAVKDQLDRASTSIPLNIAEGNAKFSDKDRSRFLEIAAGSTLECASCLDVMVVRGLLKDSEVQEEKKRLAEILQMLIGLLRRFSERAENVLREDTVIFSGDDSPVD